MRYLLHADTRRARVVVLRVRVRELLQYGTDAMELYLALRYLIYGVVLLLPADTTGSAKAWSVLDRAFGGDRGIGLICFTLGVALLLAVLELTRSRARRITLVITLAVSVGFAVGFFLGYPWAPGAYDMAAIAFFCWLCYLRERDR